MKNHIFLLIFLHSLFPISMHSMHIMQHIKDNTPYRYTLIKAGKHAFYEDQYFAIYEPLNNSLEIKKYSGFPVKVKMSVRVNGRTEFFENKVVRYSKAQNGRMIIKVLGIGEFYFPGDNESGEKATLGKHELVLFKLN